MNLPRAIVLLPEDLARRVYDAKTLAEIFRTTRCAGFVAPRDTVARRGDLAEVEVAFTGWGCGRIDASMLDALPGLRVIFYAGGSVKYWADETVWERGITVVSASAANAIPVAEYTVGAILFSLKCGWHYIGRHQREGRYPWPPIAAPGGAGVTIGIYSLGLIGRLVCERLRPFGFAVLACDPLATPAEASALGVELVPLAELFARCTIVSLHAPLLPETDGIITGELVASLPQHGTLINTARGGLLREHEVAAALARRPDLSAVLDVLGEEPPRPGNPLVALNNVFLTPHIAGAIGSESWRLGRLMLQDFRRWCDGQPLQGEVRREQLTKLA